MQSKLLKYILDIESVIEEIESIKKKTQNDFNNFSNDIILQRAIERDLEIIGEAIRKIIDINPSIQITGSNCIIYRKNTVDKQVKGKTQQQASCHIGSKAKTILQQ